MSQCLQCTTFGLAIQQALLLEGRAPGLNRTRADLARSGTRAANMGRAAKIVRDDFPVLERADTLFLSSRRGVPREQYSAAVAPRRDTRTPAETVHDFISGGLWS